MSAGSSQAVPWFHVCRFTTWSDYGDGRVITIQASDDELEWLLATLGVRRRWVHPGVIEESWIVAAKRSDNMPPRLYKGIPFFSLDEAIVYRDEINAGLSDRVFEVFMVESFVCSMVSSTGNNSSPDGTSST